MMIFNASLTANRHHRTQSTIADIIILELQTNYLIDYQYNYYDHIDIIAHEMCISGIIL